MNRDKVKRIWVCALVVAICILAACSKPVASKTYKAYEEYLLEHEETILLSDYEEIDSIELDVNMDAKKAEYRLNDGSGKLFYHWTGEIESVETVGEWERITVNAKIDSFYGNELDEDNGKETIYILRNKDTLYINHPDVAQLDIIMKMSETGAPTKDAYDMKEIHDLLYGN